MKLKRPLPKGAVLGGIVGAGLLVLLVGWFGVVRPQSQKAAALDKKTADVQQQVTSNLAAIAAQKSASAAATATPKIRVADVYKLAKAMPTNTDWPDILIELAQVADDSGVDLQNISPGSVNPDGTIGITMSVSGDFFTVTDLLYRLRNLVAVRGGALEATGRLFSVDDVSLAPTGKGAVGASLTLHTYQYGGAAAATTPAPAPAPATTGTDTTTTTTDTTATTPSSGPSAAGATP